MAEVNQAEDNEDPTLDDHLPGREQLKDRFWNILARLDEQDPQLDQIEAWLDDLEDQLDFSPALSPAEDNLSQVQIQP